MFSFRTFLRLLAPVFGTLLIFACADMSGNLKEYQQKVTRAMMGPELPEPIAASLDQMPDDAARVAAAIQKRMTAGAQGQVQKVRFADNAMAELSQPGLTGKGFVFTGAQLYQHEAMSADSSQKTTSGRLNFEDPLGRRASVRYDAIYRSAGQDLLIENANVTPIYSDFPEPVMFVLPAASLPAGPTSYHRSYRGLLQFVEKQAILPTKPASVSMEARDYVIFVFFRDPVSPSANLHVKVSDNSADIYGYHKSTRYIDFEGYRVAQIPGRFVLFGDSTLPPLYVKAVFTAGKEVGLLRRSPKIVGLYSISGPTP
jgi:hypothetical protein